MKLYTKTKLAVLSASLCLMLISGKAAAEYRLTAFGDTIGFAALMINEGGSAKAAFKSRDLARLDYFEMSNLCAAEILLKEFDTAIAHCASALVKLDKALTVSPMDRNLVKASIYSNMAVARALSGDMETAKHDLEAALSLSARHSNAKGNYAVITSKTIAPSLAQIMPQ